MDPSEREDSSTYVSQRESGAMPQQTSPNAPYTRPVQKKRKTALVLTLLLLLALAAAGALGWLWYQEHTNVASKESDISASKQQIADLTSQLKTTSAELKEKSASSGTTTKTTSSANDTMIKMALTYAKAKVANQGYPSNATDLHGQIDKQSVNFARVQVGSPTAGPGVNIIYFKKVGTDWVLLGDDNGNPERFHTAFGMPSDF
jgi:cytoskeletal protein RodZ